MGIPKDSAELKSGELAAAAGVSVDTLRHYERRGLIAPARRLANGYRSYPREAIARVLLIQRALSIGFGLEELGRVLRARDGGRIPCHEVRELAAGKLQEVEERIESLISFRDTLRRTLSDWDRRLAGGKRAEPARLLESLSSEAETETRASSFWRGARFDRRRRSRKERK